MLLVDTSVWIDYFNNHQTPGTQKFHALLGQEEVIMGDIILAEILQGIKNNRHFELVKNQLALLRCFNLVGCDIAVKSALNYRYLRAKGISIRKTIDCLIATYCIENKILLLHNDKDFIPFEKHLNLLTV